MRMYPFWRINDEEGFYELKGFAGYIHDAEEGKRSVIWLFEHMGGGLREARPGNDIFDFAQQADPEDVKVKHPKAWQEWKDLPTENL